MKLSLLANILPDDVVSPEELPGIDRMAQYIALFHGPWYLQAQLSLSAPRLDLQLWNDVCCYEVFTQLLLQNVYIFLYIVLLILISLSGN